MTVQEEVSRAVQIASAIAPQELVTRSLFTGQKVANSSASNAQEVSRASIPSISLPLPISSPETVTVQRSPAFSLTSQSFSNSSEVKVEESCFENVTTIGGCCLHSFVVSDKSLLLQVTVKWRQKRRRIWWSCWGDQGMLILKQQSPAQIVEFNSIGQVWQITGKGTTPERSLLRLESSTAMEVWSTFLSLLWD